MGIYNRFEDRLKAIDLAGLRGSTRSANIVLLDNEGADPIVGIQYQCDFRAEEEMGVGKMRELFARTAAPESFITQEHIANGGSTIEGLSQAQLVLETDDLICFAADQYIYDVDRELESAKRYLADARLAAEIDFKDRMKLNRMSVANLKSLAKSLGLKGYSKLSKRELIPAVGEAQKQAANKAAGIEPGEAVEQPGWFHNGSLLVFEKREGLFGEILGELLEAARVGQLLVGGGNIGPFGSGFTLLDARDMSEELKASVTAANSWRREQEKALEPVAEIVKQGPMKNSWGSAYYFLGKPTKFDGWDEVKFWLNGNGVKFPNGRTDQPSGYYSLQELLDEKYMVDAAEHSDEKFLRFDDKGSYRREELTVEQAAQELASRGLTWASEKYRQLAATASV